MIQTFTPIKPSVNLRIDKKTPEIL